jgi:hypothetical protein
LFESLCATKFNSKVARKWQLMQKGYVHPLEFDANDYQQKAHKFRCGSHNVALFAKLSTLDTNSGLKLYTEEGKGEG